MKRIAQSVLVVVVTAMVCHGVVTAPVSMAAESNVADGLSINGPEASAGYTLIFPMRSAVTYLVDNESRVVKQWKSRFTPAHSAHLMPNGDLIRAGAESGFGPGAGGSVQRFNWDGDLIWDFSIKSVGRDLQPHHDICPMPNGNVLLIAYEIKSAEEAEAAGRPTDGRSLQADCILEIKPTGQKSGEIVWEWHAATAERHRRRSSC